MEASETRAAHKAGALRRVGAVVLAIVLAFVAAVAIVAMINVSDSGVCEDKAFGECYDFSGSVEPIVLGFGWIGGILAGIAALLALGFAIRGRGGRPLLAAIGLSAAALAVSIITARVG